MWDRKIVGILLDLLIRLEMIWIWRFIPSSSETKVRTNWYYIGKYLLECPSKNPLVIELTSLVEKLLSVYSN